MSVLLAIELNQFLVRSKNQQVTAAVPATVCSKPLSIPLEYMLWEGDSRRLSCEPEDLPTSRLNLMSGTASEETYASISLL